MSIQSEIDRIAGAKTTLGNYLQQNGVAVPSGATLDEMALQLADVIEKQNKITARGILKGDGAGGVSAAVAGTDYQAPATDTVVTASASAWSNNTITLSVTGIMADSKLEIGLSETATDEQYAAATAAQIRATGSGDGTVTLKAATAPTIDLPIIIRRLS